MADFDHELASFLIGYGKTTNMVQVAEKAATHFGVTFDDVCCRIKVLEWKDLVRQKADPARNVTQGEPRQGLTRGWWEPGDGSYSVYSDVGVAG